MSTGLYPRNSETQRVHEQEQRLRAARPVHKPIPGPPRQYTLVPMSGSSDAVITATNPINLTAAISGSATSSYTLAVQLGGVGVRSITDKFTTLPSSVTVNVTSTSVPTVSSTRRTITCGSPSSVPETGKETFCRTRSGFHERKRVSR